jgi:mono/diheme cytochrome c family protein
MRLTGRHLPFLALSLVLLASVGLSGCGTHYPSGLRYGVRNDPLVLEVPNDAFAERMEPDPPGQLPLLSAKGLLDPRNPMHPKSDVLFEKGYLRDPKLLKAEDRAEIEKVLDEAFGTPASPKVASEEISASDIALLMLDEATLLKGSRLYRIHCLHCHGLTGDGRGPTAQWINPHPRDFRQGLFKFQSVDQVIQQNNRPPRRDDLYRTLEQGIEGTAMPSFNLLSEVQRDNLVSYVIHLSMRGKVEFTTLKEGFTYDAKNNVLVRSKEVSDPEGAAGDLGKFTRSYIPRVVADWVESQEKEKKIDLVKHASPYKEVNFELLEKGVPEQVENFKAMEASIKNGHDIFRGEKADCKKCHIDYGRRGLFKYDDWGTLVRPADLTRGVYRGGRRPIDLFYRLHSGINGSGMVKFGSDFSTRELWDIVNFVQVLPYPAMRQKFNLNIH